MTDLGSAVTERVPLNCIQNWRYSLSPFMLGLTVNFAFFTHISLAYDLFRLISPLYLLFLFCSYEQNIEL
uniref:Uncharacterized protein n=1 Tax=Anguilla anguilla TaxID=7936 RepID=A0A0E9X9A2_ANGAN